MKSIRREKRSTKTAALTGIAVGVGVLLLYVVGGITVAEWGLTEFFDRLTIGVIGSSLLAATVVVAIFAVPVAAYLRFRLVSPLVVLSVVLIAWTSHGLATGVLTLQTVFGFAIYVFAFAPVYLALYLVGGGAEYYVHC